MTSSSKGLIVPYLAVVVAGLCYLNWWQLNAPIDVSPIAPVEIEGAGSADGKPPSAAANKEPTLMELSETITRPVFRSDRKPFAAKPVEANAPVTQEQPPPQASVDTLRLVGMMRTGTSAKRALIRVAGLPNAEWVEVGGEVGGWTVGKIETDRVLVKRNGDTAELKLFGPKPTDATTPPQEPERKAP
jgi:hypothetical protein